MVVGMRGADFECLGNCRSLESTLHNSVKKNKKTTSIQSTVYNRDEQEIKPDASCLEQ